MRRTSGDQENPFSARDETLSSAAPVLPHEKRVSPLLIVRATVGA